MSPNSRPRLSLPGLMIAGVALMFAMPLAAQAASYTYINQKAPYKNPHWNGPMLTALNLPKIGTTFKVRVPNEPRWCGEDPDTSYYLAFGAKNPNLLIPGMGGFLFTTAEIVVPAPKSNTQLWVTMSFNIPNSPRLLGVRFYQQVFRVQEFWGWSEYPDTFFRLSCGGVGVIGK